MLEQLEEWGYNLSGRAIADIGNDKILFSTEQNEMVVLDKINNKIKTISFLNSQGRRSSFPRGSINIRSIHQENDSIVWLTCYYTYGLVKLNINTGLATPFLKEEMAFENKFISSILSSENTILITAYNRKEELQLIEFDISTFKKKYHKSVSNVLTKNASRSTCLLATKNGNIWVGTTLGLFEVDLQKEKVLKAYMGKNAPKIDSLAGFSQHYILPSNSILSLYENDDNDLLIGLDNGGLVILNLKKDA